MYDDIVEFAELEDFMDQKLKNYSSGMQVRLAFSVAIKAQGDILVLDEVLAVGDEAFQRKCDNFFAEIKKDPQEDRHPCHSFHGCGEEILQQGHSHQGWRDHRQWRQEQCCRSLQFLKSQNERI